MNFEKALKNPASAFATPGAIIHDQTLSAAQKFQLLKIWEYDARELEVAEEENMAGGPPSKLREIVQALHEIRTSIELHEPDSPTKHGGH